ncbi:MAG: salicylate biosynthesis isochorismate synthase [Dehalococcoidia bacterium]|nr:MAG: salicylate biosynthesis isochorismate synthase [Dehalococcoidia bacterium]
MTTAVHRSDLIVAPALQVTVSRIPAADPLALFARRGGQDGVFWAQPSEGRAFAGIGAAAVFSADGPDGVQRAAHWWHAVLDGADVQAEAGAPAAPFCLGGVAFDPLRPVDAHWRPFGGARFVVPAIAIVVEGETAWLVISRAGQSVSASADLWTQQLAKSGNATAAECVADDAAEFRAGVRQAVEEIERGCFDKLVLARQVVYARRSGFDPVSALSRLRADYPSCTSFALAVGTTVFLGATPERLVRLTGRTLWTMCLAGSAPRGRDPESDRRHAAALLADSKERREHGFVVAAMRNALAPLCRELEIPESPVVATLPNVHHLKTPITGWLRPGETILSVVEQLHPSPAVGASPPEAALPALRRYEAFNRGWFAAPVGWLDRDGGEFVVALRSALISGNEARLFAGCGIVAESDPDRELRETELKLMPMRSALEVAGP